MKSVLHSCSPSRLHLLEQAQLGPHSPHHPASVHHPFLQLITAPHPPQPAVGMHLDPVQELVRRARQPLRRLPGRRARGEWRQREGVIPGKQGWEV